MGERTTSFAFPQGTKRSSLQFGDFPTFEEIQKQQKLGIEHITAAKFWFYFRLYLPFIALVTFVAFFLIPYFLADDDDGFAFFGSLLSLVSCLMVVLSYVHVLPWRRHPSSLMLQISITSIIVSVIVLVESFPTGKYLTNFNPGGLNIIGSEDYNSNFDHSTTCQTMSFFVQMALLAREMWVFSLSMDLVTSITNPFSSYRASVQKYHTLIWTIALASATVLVNQPYCQGQFLADGTCWIRIEGTQSPCFWGYFLGWVIVFYLISIMAMVYAYVRISRGLESTYATRYACVADTFRVVFFYFGYCVVFYFFLSFVYLTTTRIRMVESVYAYFIACRGFFDALVWFFSHGFSSNTTSTNLGIGRTAQPEGIVGMGSLPRADGSYDSVTGEVRGLSKAHLRRQPTLTMADIVPPQALRRGLYYTLRSACRCVGDLIGCSCASLQSVKALSADRTGEGQDEDDADRYNLLNPERDTLQDGLEDGPDPSFTAAGGVRARPRPRPTEDIRASDFKPSDATTRTTNYSTSAGGVRPSQPSLSARSGQEGHYLSDVDLSPQLNMALRAELLYLVTLGIKESVLRLDQRDLHVLMAHSGLAGDRGSSLHPHGTSGYSPGNSRSGTSFLSQSYGASHGSTFSPYGHARSPLLAHTYNQQQQQQQGQGQGPHFTRPSMLKRDASAGSLMAPGTPTLDDGGSPAGSAQNSLKFPSMQGAGAVAPALRGAHGHHHGHHGGGGGSYSITASHAGSRISWAIRSVLAGVTGTHIPGEYGRDTLAEKWAEEQQQHPHLRASQSSSLLHASPMHAVMQGVPGGVAAGIASAATAGGGGQGTGHASPGLTQVRSMPQLGAAAGYGPGAGVGGMGRSPINDMGGMGRSPINDVTRGSLVGMRDSMNAASPHAPSAVPPGVGAASTTTAAAAGAGTTSDDRDAAPDTDLSYGNISLSEQLLEQNVELHQQQYAPPPPAIAPAEVVFNLDAKHQFRDFRPATFRKLRQMCNLSEERYLQLISQPTKERLSEGASGAFFFYCGEGELVVKTVAAHESATLLQILDRYVTYLQSRPDSLLVRFLGLHSISMYGNEFNFVVMKNIFPPNVRMNEKYDVKGSWVNRHATRKAPGKRATCKYCNESYIEGSSDKCPEVVGGHEAIVTLKDSDMIAKIRLYPDHAYALIDILNSDSDALCAMGMMDYSLLVGVKTQQYDVDALQLSTQASLAPEQRLSSFSEPPEGFAGGGSGGAAGNGGGSGSGGAGKRSASTSNAAPVDVSVYSSIYSNKHAANTRNSISNVPFEARPTIITETSDDAQTPPPEEGDAFITPGYPARAVVAPSAYYLGVIDILQTWSWSKRLEHLFKVYVLRQPAEGVSCIPPEEYKKRYQKKMAGIIEHSIFIREVTGSWRGKRHLSDPFPLMMNRGSSLSEPSGPQSLSLSAGHPLSGSAGNLAAFPHSGSSSGVNLAGRSSASGALAGILEEPRESMTSVQEGRSSSVSGVGGGAVRMSDVSQL